MFEPWVRELHVRTPGSGTPRPSPREFEPWVRELHARTRGLGNSMLEPRVLVLPLPQGVRTLGSGTLCSNPRFGELYVGTPGSGTPPPPREFEPWVRELHVPSNLKE